MTTGTRISLAIAIVTLVPAILTMNIFAVAWIAVAAFWIWYAGQAERRADRLERANEFLDDALYGKQFSEQRGYIPGGYEIDQRARDKYGPLLDRINESGGHKPISQGGIRPHLCVCGTPLEDHR